MSKFKLNFLHVCDQVLISEGKASIINIFNIINTKGFPAIAPKFFILSNTSGESGRHEEKIEIISSEDEVVASISNEIELKDDGSNNFVASFVNLLFKKEGKYWIKISMGGDVLTNKDEYYFLVKKIS